MQQIFLLCLFVIQWQLSMAQKPYQLAPPVARYNSIFFDKSVALSFEFRQAGSSIRYTLDGTEPNESSPLYKKPLVLKQHQTMVKAKTFAPSFTASETISLPFYAKGKDIAAVSSSVPNKQYASLGATILTDNRSGPPAHSDPAWMGFDSDSIVIDLKLKKTEQVNQVLVHMLRNQGAWIFLPRQMNIYAGEKESRQLVLAKTMEATKQAASGTEAILIAFDSPVSTQSLQIILYPVHPIPDWHPGKGSKAWCFIDEIKIY